MGPFINRTVFLHLCKYAHTFVWKVKPIYPCMFRKILSITNGKSYLTQQFAASVLCMYTTSATESALMAGSVGIKAFVPNSGAEKKCYITSMVTSQHYFLQPVTPSATSPFISDGSRFRLPIITNKS